MQVLIHTNIIGNISHQYNIKFKGKEPQYMITVSQNLSKPNICSNLGKWILSSQSDFIKPREI